MFKEFREFAMRGNVVDLAIGVVIGAAFGKIVDSLVGDVVMPTIGAIIGKLDFSQFFIVLGSVPPGTAMTLDALKKAGVPVLAMVAATFLAICPDLPMPVSTTRPLAFSMRWTAASNWPSSLSTREMTASASSRSTREAVSMTDILPPQCCKRKQEKESSYLIIIQYFFFEIYQMKQVKREKG